MERKKRDFDLSETNPSRFESPRSADSYENKDAGGDDDAKAAGIRSSVPRLMPAAAEGKGEDFVTPPPKSERMFESRLFDPFIELRLGLRGVTPAPA